jgi:hypothetical protein
MSFINVLEQILDCTNVVADLNIDVRIVFSQQIYIVWYHPTIVQFNAMNQKCAPRISASINRIFVYIRHRLGLELAWIIFLHLPSSMHGAFGNVAPHGPCIMHLTTISWANLFVSGFGSSTLIMQSTSSTVCGLHSLTKKMKMCACGSPCF